MARRKRVHGFGIVTEEPRQIPEPTVTVLPNEVVPSPELYRTEVLKEDTVEGATVDTVIESLYRQVEQRARSAAPVTYVSDIQNLNIVLDVLRPTDNGVRVVQTVVEFRRGRYETDDIYVQKALERHPSYGGEADKSTTNSKSYLFWRDTFPSWKWDMIAAYESELTTLPRED